MESKTVCNQNVHENTCVPEAFVIHATLNQANPNFSLTFFNIKCVALMYFLYI